MLSTRLLVKVHGGMPVSTENALGHPVEARTVWRSLPRACAESEGVGEEIWMDALRALSER